MPLFLISIAFGFAFACVMLAVSSYIKEDDGFFAIVGRFIITPMFMFSGTYAPLPPAFEWIGWVSPVWHGTDLGRVASYGHAVETPTLVIHLLYPVVIALVGLYLAYPKFTKRLSA
jgi:lipooligosaccharide transport system permease protein